MVSCVWNILKTKTVFFKKEKVQLRVMAKKNCIFDIKLLLSETMWSVVTVRYSMSNSSLVHMHNTLLQKKQFAKKECKESSSKEMQREDASFEAMLSKTKPQQSRCRL
jgi:hypothetical protein